MVRERRASRSSVTARGKRADRPEGGGADAGRDAEQPKPRYLDHRYAPLASRRRFRSRVVAAACISLSLIAATLAVGMVGYHWIESLSWLDAFHQAALLLSGMGPVVTVETTAGKVFDGLYALCCGILLLAITGILLAPIVHRIMHRFHLEDAGQQ